VRALTWARTLPFSRARSTLGGPPDPSPQEGRMQIEVKGRNTPLSEDVREHVEKRFAKVGKQVSELAVLDVELWEERNPANPDSQVAEVTLHLKGTVLRARDASRDMVHSINLCADELARQVKRDRDKRRRRREARSPGMDGPSTAPGDVSPAL
jgi:putative sigma-54 modulation protein